MQACRKDTEQFSTRVTCFPCGSDFLEQLGSHKCDLPITYLRMPEKNGMELLRRVRVVVPWIPVLFLTSYGDIRTAVEAIKAGAVDFIEKPLDKRSFVHKVMSLLPENSNHEHRGKPLTQSEQRVFQLVIDGKSNRETASLLSRSQRTFEVHRAHVMHKLGVDSLVDLIIMTLNRKCQLVSSIES